MRSTTHSIHSLGLRPLAVMAGLTLSVLGLQAQTKVRVVADNGLTTEVCSYGDDIIRVTKYPSTLSAFPKKESFSVVLSEPKGTRLTAGSALATSCIRVEVDAHGQVTFCDTKGNVLLRDGQARVDEITDGVDRGFYKASQTFHLEANEAIFGLGQRKDKDMDQRGKKVRIWSGNTNITIPYFTSVKGYGLYWDNAGRSYFDDDSLGTSFASEVSSGVDYYFLYGNGTQDDVMKAVRRLSGQATMFPLWTMGFWQCRERYKSSDELCEVVDRHRQLGIPLDGIVQDWQYWGCDSNWNAMKFLNPHYINKMGDPAYMRYLPDNEDKNARYPEPRIKSPQEMVDYVHSQNAHLMISIWANFGPWTDQYRELDKIGALYPFATWPYGRGVKPYDPFNPKARDIYWKYLKNLYDMHIDAWWSDSTEPDHDEKPGDDDHMTYAGSWRAVKNAFPLLTNIGIYEHQRRAKGGNDKRAFQMTRCGAFGLQRSAAFNWSGDIEATWAEFKKQIPSGLNYTVCGNPMWNTDLGGFFYWDFQQDPSNPALAELQTRWMQWGALMPLMRNHCSSPMISEIYLYGDKGHWAYDAMVDAVKLRYRLLPYIYSQAGACVQRSETMMRPFVFDFPSDERAIRVADEYMFGHNILVHPVTDPLYTWKDDNKRGHLIYPDVKQAAAPVRVYLPKGTIWYDFWTNQRHEGGRTISRLAPINIIPLYVRAGSILPLGPDVQYASEKAWDDLEVRIYPGEDGDYTLYEDEGDNYNYEKGAFTQINFHWDEDRHELTIGRRQGTFKGMLSNRRFRIVLVGKDTPAATIPTEGTPVDYNGEEVTIELAGNHPVTRRQLANTALYEDITTTYITNPSFEDDGQMLTRQAPKGWTVKAQTNWWGVNRGSTAGNPPATDGNFIFGVWDANVQEASIMQTITNLPKGDYVLTVDMHASDNGSGRVGNQALLAGQAQALFAEQVTRPGNTDTEPMGTIILPFSLTETTSLPIGVHTSEAKSSTWFKVDNFRLYRKK